MKRHTNFDKINKKFFSSLFLVCGTNIQHGYLFIGNINITIFEVMRAVLLKVKVF